MKPIRFKRFSVAGIICTLLMILFIVPVSAAGTPAVTAANIRAQGGSTVGVTISLSSNPGIWGVRLKVDYDHEKLQLQRCEAGNIFTADEITSPPDLEQASYIFMADKKDFTNTTDNGVLVTLFFAVDGNAELKDYPITLSVIEAIDADGNSVALTSASGKITVEDCWHDGEKTVVNEKDATEAEEGYTGDTKCSKCGKVIETGTVIPKLEKKPVVYHIIQGAEGEWKTDAKEGYSFTADGAYDKFRGIQIDGAATDDSKYVAVSKDNQVTVTLNPDYLKTLSAGRHFVKLIFSDGEVSTTFTVTSAGNVNSPTDDNLPSDSNVSPPTGDNLLILPFILISLISAAVIGNVSQKRKFKVTNK